MCSPTIDNELPRLNKLPNSARYVLTFLKLRQLVYCEDAVSFREIVEGTGLSPRTVRKVLSFLKSAGLLKITHDVKSGRRNLYQLDIKQTLTYFKSRGSLIAPGIYFIDVGLGVKKFLSPRALAAILSCDHAIVTDSVPDQITELIPGDAAVSHAVSVLKGKAEIDAACLDNITVVLYDSLLDCGLVSALYSKLSTLKRNVFYVSSVSPIDYALRLLELGRHCRVRFRRSPTVLEIYVRVSPGTNMDPGSVIKAYLVRYACRAGAVEFSLSPVDPQLGSLTDIDLRDGALIVYLQGS